MHRLVHRRLLRHRPYAQRFCGVWRDMAPCGKPAASGSIPHHAHHHARHLIQAPRSSSHEMKNGVPCTPLSHSLPTAYSALIDRFIHRDRPILAGDREAMLHHTRKTRAALAAQRCRTTRQTRERPGSERAITAAPRTAEFSTAYPRPFHRLTHMKAGHTLHAHTVIPTYPAAMQRLSAGLHTDLSTISGERHESRPCGGWNGGKPGARYSTCRLMSFAHSLSAACPHAYSILVTGLTHKVIHRTKKGRPYGLPVCKGC